MQLLWKEYRWNIFLRRATLRQRSRKRWNYMKSPICRSGSDYSLDDNKTRQGVNFCIDAPASGTSFVALAVWSEASGARF